MKYLQFLCRNGALFNQFASQMPPKIEWNQVTVNLNFQKYVNIIIMVWSIMKLEPSAVLWVYKLWCQFAWKWVNPKRMIYLSSYYFVMFYLEADYANNNIFLVKLKIILKEVSQR